MELSLLLFLILILSVILNRPIHRILSVQKVSVCRIQMNQTVKTNEFIFIFFHRFDFAEISILKQTLTTTTITTEYTEIKKNKDDIGHIMISYNHSTKAMCSRIAKELKVKEKIRRRKMLNENI